MAQFSIALTRLTGESRIGASPADDEVLIGFLSKLPLFGGDIDLSLSNYETKSTALMLQLNTSVPFIGSSTDSTYCIKEKQVIRNR